VKTFLKNPLTLALMCFGLGALLIVLIPRNTGFRWIAVGLYASVCLSNGLAVRRQFRMRADAAARTVAAIVGHHHSSTGMTLAPVLDLRDTVDGRGPIFDPILRAAREASEYIVAERTRLEQRGNQLEVLLEGMQDAVLGVDAAGRAQWSNGHMQRLMGRDTAGVSVRHGRALVHTFRDPGLLAAVQKTLDEGVSTECRSESIVAGRIFLVHASPLPGGGAVVVLHDNTQAEQMERTQRDFVANVSHELRTPLTSIVGYVETVLDHETLSGPAREFLDTVLKNASRMHRLTEDLLLLTRVERADNPLEPLPVQADQLLRDAVNMVSGATYAEGARLEVGGSTRCLVLADENAILQVLANLLENAVKYSTGIVKQPHVIVSASNADNAVEFCVKDFGPGIASEHLPRIFERFYRVEKARSRATGGTGLGLSIARDLIEQHGGRIWVESALGEGSTFRFTLPYAD
jgi:two-component system phosphate regulon sensor histidine kinase PhoR